MKEAMLSGKGRVSPYMKGSCGCISKKMKLDRPEHKGNTVLRIKKK
jgi:hypothetical protein